MSKPLAIELFAGLFGWGVGLVAEGWRSIGFDIVQMGPVPEGCTLVLQDVLTLHGSQFKDAALIVASPPCQAYSYRAMPWRRAKALPPPDNTLFEACFRIQREANVASGRHIPMVVENVCGAQKWVGPAKWHYGSYYLWGDVPAVMPWVSGRKVAIQSWSNYEKPGYVPQGFNVEAAKAIKNSGGSWFNVAHNTTSGVGNNPDGRKTVGHVNMRDGHNHTRHLTNQRENDAVKHGGEWFHDPASPSRQGGSKNGIKTDSRKAASALIAKIPGPLARHIARVYKPL